MLSEITCPSCGRGAGLGALAPDLMTAGHNVRECAKQLLLLEDHLVQPHRRCPDCIHKHALAAEALADEARTLEGAGRWSCLDDLGQRIRQCSTHQEVRQLRKGITSAMRAQGLEGLEGDAPCVGGLVVAGVALWWLFA